MDNTQVQILANFTSLLNKYKPQIDQDSKLTTITIDDSTVTIPQSQRNLTSQTITIT